MNLYKRSSAKLTRKANNATTLCGAILKRDGKARSLHLCLSLVVHIRRNHRHQHVFYVINFFGEIMNKKSSTMRGSHVYNNNL